MKKFLQFFITKPVAVCLAALFLAAFGLYGALSSPFALSAHARNVELVVCISLPEADAQTVKRQVSDAAESALTSLRGVESVFTQSQNGLSSVTVRFAAGADADESVQAVLVRLAAVPLPAAASRPTVRQSAATAAEIVLMREDGDLTRMFSQASALGDSLCALKGALAVVVQGAREDDECYFNNARAVRLQVQAQDNASLKSLIKGVRGKIDALSKDGLSAVLLYEAASAVQRASVIAALCLIAAFVLAFGVLLLLFKDAKSAAAAIAVNLVALLASLALLKLFALPLGFLTVAGLAAGSIGATAFAALCAGSMRVRLQAGENGFAASRNGAAKAVPSLLGCLLCFAAVLVPVACIGKTVFAVFAVAALLTLAAAFIAALLLLPCLFCLLHGGAKYYRVGNPLKKDLEPSQTSPVRDVTAQPLQTDEKVREALGGEYKDERVIDDYIIPSLGDIMKLNKKARRAVRKHRLLADKPFETVKKGYAKSLSAVLKRKTVVIAAALALLFASLLPVFSAGVETLPTVNGAALTVQLTPQAGTSSAIVRQFAFGAAQTLTENLTDAQDVTLYVRRTGEETITAEIIVTFDKRSAAKKRADEARALLNNNDGVKVAVEVAKEVVDSHDNGASVQIYGDDINALKEIAREIEKKLLRNDGFRSVTDNLSENGIISSEGRYLLSLRAQTSGLSVGAASNTLQSVTAQTLKDYPDFYYRASGVQPEMSKQFNALFLAAALSVVLLYALFSMRLGNFVKPLAVLPALPFALGGAFCALAIVRTPLSCAAFLGILLAFAVCAHSAGALLCRIENAVREGSDVFTAAVTGAAARLKYTLFAALGTFAASLPLCFATGSAAVLRPLGIALTGGTLLGGIALLLLTPLVYCLAKRSEAIAETDDTPVYDLDESDVEIEVTPPPSETQREQNDSDETNHEREQSSDEGIRSAAVAPPTDLPPPPDKIFL